MSSVLRIIGKISNCIRKIGFLKLSIICAVLLLIFSIFFSTFFFLQHKYFSGLSKETVAQSVLSTEVVHKSESMRLPIRLKIPSLQIDTAIQYVGIAPDGTMDVPSNVEDVGWYKFGSIPGDLGSAVIAGHLDGENGTPGVFAKLHLLNPGDKGYIENDNGTVTSFIVRDSRIYNPLVDTTAIYGQNEGHHLNLITCFGTWNANQNSYAKRLVVFTDIIQ